MKDNAQKKPGAFRGLVDLVASLHAAVQEHLQRAAVSEGTSETGQN